MDSRQTAPASTYAPGYATEDAVLKNTGPLGSAPNTATTNPNEAPVPQGDVYGEPGLRPAHTGEEPARTVAAGSGSVAPGSARPVNQGTTETSSAGAMLGNSAKGLVAKGHVSNPSPHLTARFNGSS